MGNTSGRLLVCFGSEVVEIKKINKVAMQPPNLVKKND